MFFSCSFTAFDAFCVNVENDLSSLQPLFRALKTKWPTPKYGMGLGLRAYVLSGFEAIYEMKVFYKGRRLLGELVPADLL